jgi:hypothetical protein
MRATRMRVYMRARIHLANGEWIMDWQTKAQRKIHLTESESDPGEISRRPAIWPGLAIGCLVSAGLVAGILYGHYAPMVSHLEQMATKYQGAYDPDHTFYWRLR